MKNAKTLSSKKKEKGVSQADLKEFLNFDPEVGIFTWAEDRGGAKKGQVAGTDWFGYRRVRVKGRQWYAHRLAWLWEYGEWPPNEVDHINGVASDNRIANLRLADSVKNKQNMRKPMSNNKSGFLGVSFCGVRKKWKAQIRYKGCNRFIGYFSSPEEAHKAYLKEKREHHKFCTI